MNKLVLNADLGKTTISRHIYGHFIEHLGRCVYEGLYVGEGSPIANTRGFRNDVVAALRQLNMPNLRWPGGCFADTYHWRDGIGPKSQRPSMVNIHWGGTTENNHVGTHEFLDLCEQLSTKQNIVEPYIAGNMGSGTIREMSDWLEYLTHPGPAPMAELRKKNGRQKPWDNIKFWGVGNENWGCGGEMKVEYYTNEYRRYQLYCRHYNKQKLYKVACGLDVDWNEVLLREAARFIDGLSVHYYTIPSGVWQKKGSSTEFDEKQWWWTLKRAGEIHDFIVRNKCIMDRFDKEKRIGMIMDEWGTWYDVEPGTNPGFLYQQNTVRDALVAGLTLNILHSHADRVHMANIAQTVNVLQAMVLTEGPRMVLTPTYHVFDMYKAHQDATLLPIDVQADDYSIDDPKQTIPQISASASIDKKGKITLSLVNLHHSKAASLACDIRGAKVKKVSGRVLSGAKMNTRNTFESPHVVAPKSFTGASLKGGVLNVKMPAKSVVVLDMV